MGEFTGEKSAVRSRASYLRDGSSAIAIRDEIGDGSPTSGPRSMK
jgi:hypothetical protein